MAFQTIYTSGTGMLGMEQKLNTVANNLANMETTAFKKQRCNFEDLFYDNWRYPGTQDVNGDFTATGIQIGLGTRVTSVQSHMRQGGFKETDRELDVAIQGNGFFQVTDPLSGEIFYSRAGNFSVNPNGQLVLGSAYTGRLIEPPIQIPEDATKIQIGSDGTVMVAQGNIPQMQQVGAFQLATFVNPEGLLRLGENLFQETESSGPPLVGPPGLNSVGVLQQNAIEASNVQPVVELIDMITTQRAYELNSQVTRTGDEVLQTVINIKR
ncbi:MAG: flagellar basal-body rod protein FlgG [Thermoguttaceae bacterium]